MITLRNAQASFEYLLTIGAAILVLMVVIEVLASTTEFSQFIAPIYAPAFDSHDISADVNVGVSSGQSNGGTQGTNTSSGGSSGGSGSSGGGGSSGSSGSGSAGLSQTYSLTVLLAGDQNGGVVTGTDINCGSVCAKTNIAKDSPITLHATPAPGYLFSGWSGDCSGSSDCNSTVTANTTITATFVPSGSGIQFSVDQWGLRTLSYNDMNFIVEDNYGSFYNDKAVGAVFVTPQGETHSYYPQMGSGVLSTGSPLCSGNSQCFSHSFREGLSDAYAMTVVFTPVDTRTLQIDINFINHDMTDTITQTGLDYWLGTNFTTPGPIDSQQQDCCHISTNPVAWIHGPTWGSVALFSDRYDNNFSLHTRTYSSLGPWGSSKVSELFTLDNSIYPGGDVTTNSKYQYILPGQTASYRLFIRFGTVHDTPFSLAPEAYAAYRAAYPYLVNWPNRAPIARWFIAEGEAHISEKNPRGFLWDPDLNVLDQATFSARVLNQTDAIVARMNAMTIKPQGIIIWDLEGEEFSQIFTYVGYPNKLHDLAPEMDAVADAMFKKFTDAGYRVGITLRPTDFQTGTTVPATCNVDPLGQNWLLSDVFIKTDGAYSHRGYECVATNTWRMGNYREPGFQHSSNDDAVILGNLRSKVAYAKSRWGVTLFYVDSTVYGGGGSSFNFEIFRQLQKEFPDVIFFPENENTQFYGASAPYNQADMTAPNVPIDAKYIYPQAFSLIAHAINGPLTQEQHDALVQSIKNGNILMYEGIWYAPDTAVEQLYLDANFVPQGN